MPEIPENRCKDDIVQARQGIEITAQVTDVGMRLLVFDSCLHTAIPTSTCTCLALFDASHVRLVLPLPSLHLPTYLENALHITTIYVI